jgi:hypothetical protein
MSKRKCGCPKRAVKRGNRCYSKKTGRPVARKKSC